MPAPVSNPTTDKVNEQSLGQEPETAYECLLMKMKANQQARKTNGGEGNDPLPCTSTEGGAHGSDPCELNAEAPTDNDGVLVTVHAPEGDFYYSDDEDQGSEVGTADSQALEPTNGVTGGADTDGVMQIDLSTNLSEADKTRIRSDPGFQQLLRQLLQTPKEEVPEGERTPPMAGRFQRVDIISTNNNATRQGDKSHA